MTIYRRRVDGLMSNEELAIDACRSAVPAKLADQCAIFTAAALALRRIQNYNEWVAFYSLYWRDL